MPQKNYLKFIRISVPVAHLVPGDNAARSGVMLAGAHTDPERIESLDGVRITDSGGGRIYDVVAETRDGRDVLRYTSQLAIHGDLGDTTAIPDSELAYLAIAWTSGTLESATFPGGWHVLNDAGEKTLMGQWEVPIRKSRERPSPEAFAAEYERNLAAFGWRGIRDRMKVHYQVSVHAIDDWTRLARAQGFLPPATGSRGKYPRRPASTDDTTEVEAQE